MNGPLAPLTDPHDREVERQIQRMTRRSFSTAAIASLAALAGGGWLRTRPDDNGIPWPLRRVLEWNATLAQAYFRPTRFAPTFSTSVARMPRVNGHLGLGSGFDPATWSLRLENSQGRKPLLLTLDQIQALPRVETVTELKCIEGWSDPVRWTGVRLADLAARFGKATRSGRPADFQRSPSDLFRYVSLSTPDMGYYVGLDIESALHPQTLLCYAMDDRPLSLGHGAPLRLAIPVKYGIKNIKRIGTIRFTDERPADYWAERGYDWYAGH
jgi:DMSO/TMAO reductase YedYZ molybdopterin-dependent catalytic subunit